MRSLTALTLASLLATAAAAHAADLLPPPPPPDYPPPHEEFSGWYIRGDVGVAAQLNRSGSSKFAPGFGTPAQAGIHYDSNKLGDPAMVDLGFGYQFNNWFRADITGELRTTQDYHGLESFPTNGGRSYDVYSGQVRSAVFLLNGYVDLGTWYGLTPFIGASVGLAANRMGSFVDNGIGGYGVYSAPTPAVPATPTTAAIPASQGGYAANFVGLGGVGFSQPRSVNNVAWGVTGGLAYNVNQNLKLEGSIRYLNMGMPYSGQIQCQPNPKLTNDCQKEQIRLSLSSIDVRLGMRWLLADFAPPPAYRQQEPLIRKY